jgi:hypothetical protein
VDVIHELLATQIAVQKLGARSISIEEAQQLIDNRYVIVRNPRRRGRARRLVVGRTMAAGPSHSSSSELPSRRLGSSSQAGRQLRASVRSSMVEMKNDPWNEPDPQPGDFDDELEAVDPRDVQVVEAGSGGKVTIVVSVEGEDAKRLDRIATERGQPVEQVVADLVRQA